MQDEKVADLIQLAEYETQDFQNFQGSTLMGWFPQKDQQGRIVNADPNKQWSVFSFENLLAKAVRIEWEVKLYVNSKSMSYDEAMLPSLENWDEVATLDLTPSYI